MQEAVQYLLEKEAVFEHIVEKYGMPTIPKRPQGFETLVLLILEQQVSIDSAKATFLKLKAKMASLFPESLFHFSDEDYRSIGVSRQKNGLHQGFVPFDNSKGNRHRKFGDQIFTTSSGGINQD